MVATSGVLDGYRGTGHSVRRSGGKSARTRS